MSDPATEAPERPWPVRVLLRWRAVLVLVPLLAGLLIAAAVGANMLRAEPERDDTVPDVTCWDGAQRPAAECTEPTGVAGLRWVFPSVDPDECRQVQARGKNAASVVQLVCRTTFAAQTVRITYTRRPSAGASKAALRKSFGNAEPSTAAGGDRLSYRARDGDGLLTARVGVTYADHPFSVIVEAPDSGLRDRALRSLVRFRPADQVRVRPETEA
ncbi:hypothetical protein GCM10023340_00230 [Nocardioides marinquilinus]|uniref:DUF3515 family protein n=1 Tax=Nocardioides marinquilinus TaxID=1210400 RepID=A0ABP9P791_9ACTN